MRLHDGTVVPTTDGLADADGGARRRPREGRRRSSRRRPSLVFCDYNYMPPLHLAVREGHLDVVRFLAERGAVNPNHRTYPYNETAR